MVSRRDIVSCPGNASLVPYQSSKLHRAVAGGGEGVEWFQTCKHLTWHALHGADVL